MLRPTQVEGEFENIFTFLLIAFNSRFIFPYFFYPNIHLPGLSSRALPHNRLEFVVGSSLQPLLLVGFSPATPIFLSS